MKKSRILIALLGFVISTACLGQSASGDKLWLSKEDVDYLLYQNARAMALQQDSAVYCNLIVEKNQQIMLLTENQKDLKSTINNGNGIIENYKIELSAVRGKLSTSEGRLKRRTGILIGSMAVNIAFIGAVVLILK